MLYEVITSGLLVVRQPLEEPRDETSRSVTLWRVPLDGSASIQVASLRLPPADDGFLGAFNFSLYPDGSRIAFERHAGFIAQTWAT